MTGSAFSALDVAFVSLEMILKMGRECEGGGDQVCPVSGVGGFIKVGRRIYQTHVFP